MRPSWSTPSSPCTSANGPYSLTPKRFDPAIFGEQEGVTNEDSGRSRSGSSRREYHAS